MSLPEPESATAGADPASTRRVDFGTFLREAPDTAGTEYGVANSNVLYWTKADGVVSAVIDCPPAQIKTMTTEPGSLEEFFVQSAIEGLAALETIHSPYGPLSLISISGLTERGGE